MFESFNINYRFLYVLLSFLTFGCLYAQDKNEDTNIEKVYLHTDRSKYFMGEDLWYKSYNVNAYTNLLSNNSNVLYVELISPDSKIIARNKTNLELGLGHGDFKLTDSIGVKAGSYQIRAYTNWNRNFGEDFVFKKNIEIVDVFEAHSNYIKTQNIAIEANASKSILQNTFKIDFFPEGGSLLENAASVVGFKAVDNNGNPIDIEGEIYDSDNQLITSFSSAHDGMGKFQMISIRGKRYYAKVKTHSGAELRRDLPKALKQGYLLSFRVFKGRNILSVNTNQETLSQNPNQELKIVCSSKGVPYLEAVKNVTEAAVSFDLTKDKLPEGISQITLYDSNSRPQSERLFYIEKERDLEVQLITNKTNYKPNEKATIYVNSTSKSGEAKFASFSLSITDMNGEIEDKDYGTTISSYFLLESDIRGRVHNPSCYFNPNNLKRLEYLDNLLLTQGWRDFLWKTMPKQDDTRTYKAEKGITISGRVKQVFGNNPLVNNNVTLGLTNKHGFNAFSSITDSTGGFKFEDLMFSGKTNMYLNSRNEKGRFRGYMLLDSIGQPPMAVTFKSGPMYLPQTTQLIIENVYRKYVAFGVPPENVLDEVEIIAKKTSDVDVFYGVPDYSYISDKNTKKLITIYDVLDKVPGVLVVDRTVSIPGEHGIPLILIDGYPDSALSFVSPSEVVKIEVVRWEGPAKVLYGEEAKGGLISIFTNGKSKSNRSKKVPVHSIKKQIEGFYNARVFYSPDPNKPSLEMQSTDAVRNTLYWNPYIHPDQTGTSQVSYYNSEVETTVKVTLEGITATGIPVVKKVFYTVEE